MHERLRIVCLHKLYKLLDWLDASNLIIHIHAANEYCIVTQLLRETVQINLSVRTDFQEAYLEAFLLQELHRGKYRCMLDRCRDNMLARAAVCQCRPD